MSLTELRTPILGVPGRLDGPAVGKPGRKDGDQRTWRDIVPPENFPRVQLDRSIGSINFLYQVCFGPDRTPLQTATDVLRSKGRVDLFDVGCGTGYTLLTWGRAAARAVGAPDSSVTRTGISLHDYSEESSHPTTLQAHREGKIKYVVGDAANMPELSENSFDITLANASLIHADDPVSWMQEMLRVTRPGGVLYFDH